MTPKEKIEKLLEDKFQPDPDGIFTLGSLLEIKQLMQAAYNTAIEDAAESAAIITNPKSIAPRYIVDKQSILKLKI